MSNLYEILEVSEKASKEVIEKAYRVLAKKYHPDLQMQEEKQNAEKKMKQINEAYDILSNEEKRKEYDRTLAEEREREKKRELEKQEQSSNQYYEKEIEQVEKENQKRENTAESYQNVRKIQQEINQAYSQAYRNYVRSLRISNKRTMDLEKIYQFVKSTWSDSNYYYHHMVLSTNP